MSDVVEHKNIYFIREPTFVLIMNTYFHSPTPEYAEFIEEYNCFLEHYVKYQNVCKKNYTYSRDYTEDFLEYTQAVEAHINAINAYIRLVAIYERLALKYWRDVHMQDY